VVDNLGRFADSIFPSLKDYTHKKQISNLGRNHNIRVCSMYALSLVAVPSRSVPGAGDQRTEELEETRSACYFDIHVIQRRMPRNKTVRYIGKHNALPGGTASGRTGPAYNGEY